MTYFTTPIYYVNEVPHIGHAYSTVIADALARWERLRGRPSRLVTGTDEHGAKVARAAAAKGVAPAVLADATAPRFGSAWDRLGIGYDDFVRTTSARHRAVTASLLTRVHDARYVRPGRYEGRYCVGCEAYVSTAVCAVHRTPTEVLSEDNWFFRLSAFARPLAAYLDGDVVRPRSRRNEALSWLRRGLVDFSISRASLTWGVPLPWDPTQVAYVWFDALGAYLTGGYAAPAHHVIGKDILRFHAIWWPAILLAADLPLPARITAHGFLLRRGGKIAKSAGGAEVGLDDLVDRFGADGLRYHLLRDNPIGPDGEFTVPGVTARYNADLANTLGNLVSRLTALVSARPRGVAPAPAGGLSTVAASAVDAAGEAWDDGRPSDALAATWRLVAAANAHLVAAAPWRAEAGDPGAAGALGDALEALRIAALLAAPAIPTAAATIATRLGGEAAAGGAAAGRAAAGGTAAGGAAAAGREAAADLAWGASLAGHRIVAGPPLFPRLGPAAEREASRPDRRVDRAPSTI